MESLKNRKKLIDILLIEDNTDDVFLTEYAIKECNIDGNFLVINNGETAIYILREMANQANGLPDIILLDINLPKINGLEILKYIKTQDATKQIHTIVFTSSDSITDMKYCYELGADLYIRKPNNVNDFKEIIQYIKNLCFIN